MRRTVSFSPGGGGGERSRLDGILFQVAVDLTHDRGSGGDMTKQDP
jgi:hypothetical protein